MEFAAKLWLCSLLLATCTACARTEATPESARDSRSRINDAVPVETATAEIKTVPVTVDAVGTAEAIATVQVRSQVAGQLITIHFEPGQDVRKGQPLFTLDSRPFEAAVRQAEAILARDQAQATDAQAQQARAENLFNRGLLPRNQYETQKAGAEALGASVAADRAQLDQARLNLQYTRIAAPIDGRTGALMAHAGDLVRANDTNPLVTINQLSPIYVSFPVPARMLDEIRRNQASAPLSVTALSSSPAEGRSETEGGGSQPIAQGRVAFIDNAIDPATATITIKATFDNRDRRLWPGLFVPISLRLASQPDAIVVPSGAVQTSQQGQYVYVVKADRTVDLRPVTVEREQDGLAVVARGIAGGDEVVTAGHLRLTPGARVTIAGRSEANR